MSDPTRRTLFWLGIAVAFVAALYLIRDILLPFVLGMGIAYAFDPVADRLVLWGFRRGWASAAVLIFLFAAVATVIAVLFPLIEGQIVDLARRIPDLIAWVREQAAPILNRIQIEMRPEDTQQLQEAAKSYSGAVISWFGKLVSGIWSSGLAVVDVISLLLVMPMVAFYLLRDWDDMVARIDSWLPRAQAPIVRAKSREIDQLISGWVRGVASVCLILAAYYGTCLTVVGLNYGLLIGIGAGFLTFIPFAGATLAFVVAMSLALFQFDSWLPVVLVALVFAVGQILESNILTPKLVGEKVGLHPVWVLFALFAGGALFGFVGVLLAVPAAAAIGVLVRYAIDQYLGSPLYLGPGAKPPAPGDRER